MNVTCDKCNKRYAIADDKVRGKSVKIRCKQCQNLISVQGPPAGAAGQTAAPLAATSSNVAAPGVGGMVGSSPWEDERTRAMPALDLSPTWFAMVKGKQIGPLTLRDLELRVKTGEVSLRTYLWKQGMADWKRASDVPEVSPVFAGVSVGASAVGPVQPAPAASRPTTKSSKAVARDVATANEVPSPEITRKGNGNGHGADEARPVAAPFSTQPLSSPQPSAPARPKTGQFAKPVLPDAGAPAPAAVPRPSIDRKTGAQPRVEPKPQPAPAPTPGPERSTTLETTVPGPSENAPLNDLFNDVSGLHPRGEEPLNPGETSPDAGAAADKNFDPFAALGEADPKDAPPPGEATKFFIAKAGVNKRNPPWKIALFVFSIIGLPVGVLFMLSKLHVVPPVMVQNEKGELVEQEFFTPAGFSTGIKDLLSGDTQKKKAEAEAKRAAAERAAEAKRVAARAAQNLGNQQAGGRDVDLLPGRREDRQAAPKYTKEELEKLYGSSGPTGSEVSLGSKSDVGPKVRLESQAPTIEKGGGLDADAVAKTMNERMKALVGCVEDALKRNPNVKLEKVVLVMQVGTSGAVKGVSLEPKRVELTDLGGCLRDRAKKITFPAADSDSEIQIPLVLGAAMGG
ncbi:MAG: zinc-ribbon domain-containing protein [Archangiaceae bacterium]|nr:zinc-ribbon domain-containing protein [Archangiaceae bacterium]